MLKHVKQILSGLRSLDIAAEVITGKGGGHISLRISRPGGKEHRMTVASSPTIPEVTIFNSIKQAKRLTQSATKPK